MKVMMRPARFSVGKRQFAVGVFCGERWYRLSSWTQYGIYGRLKSCSGFHVGPILFWDGK